MIDFFTGTKKYTVTAESYNELSADQLLKLCSIFLRREEKQIAEWKALKILLKINLYQFLRLSQYAKKEMISTIGWIFDRNSLTKQLLPVYKGFYGPDSEWDNLTMAEWNACEIYYEQMVAGDDEALNNLISVLYRKPKPSYDRVKNIEGDIRIAFNANLCAYYAKKKIKKWNPSVKMAIVTWYDGCREMMKETYDLFSNDNTTADKKQPGMFEIIRVLCGDKYGSFENVEKMNVHQAFRELELMKNEAEEIKKLYQTA